MNISDKKLANMLANICFLLTKKVTVDFGEVKIVPTKCKEKCFQMTSSAYLHHSKAPQNVLMFYLRKRSAR